jgi:ankyrin repeat protein
MQGHLSAVKALLENGADVNHVNKNGVTALGTAKVSGHKAVADFLKENGAKE